MKQELVSEGTGHDWWHITRVRNLGMAIAVQEAADVFIVDLACLLHDIGDLKLEAGDVNGGANKICNWLDSLSVPTDIIDQICSMVAGIAVVDAGLPPELSSLEGKVLSDADALDAMGATGIARVFTFGGARGRLIYDPGVSPVRYTSLAEYQRNEAPSINHFYEKLLLLESLMQTKTGRRLARGRHLFMQSFLSQFFDEWAGIA